MTLLLVCGHLNNLWFSMQDSDSPLGNKSVADEKAVYEWRTRDKSLQVGANREVMTQKAVVKTVRQVNRLVACAKAGRRKMKCQSNRN